MKEFKTRAGRKVYDGGGVLPDIALEAKKLNNITASLISKNIIFDYATHYRNQHSSIIAAKDFKISDQDWTDFLSFIADKEYDYTTKSEKSLDELKKNSEDEKYFEGLKTEYDALKNKLSHNKREDVTKNREEICEILQQEIASRYYYQVGKIEASFSCDQEIKKAIEVLANATLYSSILDGTYKASAHAEQEGPEEIKK
jgi:carboxyl-terminal processing protease